MKNHPFHIIHLDETDSTNRYAQQLIGQDEVAPFTVFTTKNQTAGRGQANNVWVSEKGKNILCSIIFSPTFLPPIKQFELSKVMALAVADLCQSLLPEKKIFIKWPNDIYVEEKKIAGMLIEHIISGVTWKWTIAGIGLNVLQTSFPPHLPNPTSLFLENSGQYKPDDCLDKLLEKITFYYSLLYQKKYKELHDLYLSKMLFLGEERLYIYQEKEIKATITGISNVGWLELITSGQKKISCDLKEIKYCLSKDHQCV